MGKKIMMLLVICILFIISSNVFAAIPDGMSEEFKSILNEEGQLVITDTMNNDNSQNLLAEFMSKYATEEYGVIASFTNEEKTKCRIERYKMEPYEVLESYDVDIVYEEKFSEDFKEITKNGELVITSSNNRGKEAAIFNYCYAQKSDESCNFIITDLNELDGTCTIKLYKLMKPEDVNTRLVEQHKVKVTFEEKFSDRFKEVAKDGKIVIQASRETKKENLLYTYCSMISNYDVGNNYGAFSATDLNEDVTKCTLQMYENYEEGNTIKSRLVEEHIVNIEYIKTMSDYYKKHLNKDGKLVIDSIKPKDFDEWVGMHEVMYYNNGIRADIEFLAEDFSSCEITIINDKGYPETHMVEFEYKYDEKIKQTADKITESIKKGEPHYFYVKDLELINYWLNSGDESEKKGASNFDNYSGELKEFTNYKNFNLSIDHRMGADDEFFTLRGGIGLLQYKGTTYYINTLMAVLGNHILYVPDNTESTREALAAAVQKRVDEYVGEGKVKITAGEGTIDDYYKNYSNKKIKELQNKIDEEEAKANPNKNLINEYKSQIDWYKEWYNYEYFKESYNNPEGEHYFLKNAEGDYWFIATIDGVEYEFIVIKDSSKMVTPKYKTADLKTNVEISSTSTEIPLDTSVEAEKITEGAEYEKILKILDVKENVTYDLNLFSKSLNKYVKKLADGKFEVRIPVPENLKNKKLSIYYVDENGKTEEYEVKIEGEYAVFKTNHFSTYTLAEEKAKVNEVNPDKENNTNDKNSNNNNTTNNNIIDKNKENSTTNPNTGDNIMFFVALLLISIAGMVVTTRYRKKC